jgi:hypothetical protein
VTYRVIELLFELELLLIVEAPKRVAWKELVESRDSLFTRRATRRLQLVCTQMSGWATSRSASTESSVFSAQSDAYVDQSVSHTR